MVCTANDLQEWKDFPKGLRVLLLDRDSHSASTIKSKLEEMEYVVYSYCDEEEAFSAISSTPGNFHLAILEVFTGKYDESFKLLEFSKDLPIIMISTIHCLSTMMKCIALGAVEFLLKPLSEDKLKNLWQHVIHKAFLNSPRLVKESVASAQLQSEDEDKNKIPVDMECIYEFQDKESEHPERSDNLPTSATPELNQGVILLDSWESQDLINCLMETDCREKDGQFKFVETTSNDLVCEGPPQECQPQSPRKTIVEENEGSDAIRAAKHSIPGSDVNHSAGFKADRKKTKVDWTSGLHSKFVLAVEKLGIDHAVPSKILELMKVKGLTRHNIASHLQKYRMQKSHAMPKQGPYPRGPIQFQPIAAAFPPHPFNCGVSASAVYPTWRQPIGCPANALMWGPLGYHHWQQPGVHHWNPHIGGHADAWGCPVMLPSHAPYFSYPQHVSASHDMYTANNSYGMPHSSFDLQPDEELIDKAVKEAMSKPWSALPLGLKPPSTESVLSELSRQGISTVPPLINGSLPP